MKKIATLALVLLLSFSAALFAAERKLTITTYYPAPYGEYKTLKVTDGDTTAGNILTSDGTGKAVWQAGGVRPPDYDSGWRCVQSSGGYSEHTSAPFNVNYSLSHTMGVTPEKVEILASRDISGCNSTYAGQRPIAGTADPVEWQNIDLHRIPLMYYGPVVSQNSTEIKIFMGKGPCIVSRLCEWQENCSGHTANQSELDYPDYAYYAKYRVIAWKKF